MTDLLKRLQTERPAGPVQGEPKQCFTCNGRTFAKVHGQENAYRCVECKTVLAQPTQQPDEARVERVAKAIEPELDKQEMLLSDPVTIRRLKAARIARAAIAAMKGGSND